MTYGPQLPFHSGDWARLIVDAARMDGNVYAVVGGYASELHRAPERLRGDFTCFVGGVVDACHVLCQRDTLPSV